MSFRTTLSGILLCVFVMWCVFTLTLVYVSHRDKAPNELPRAIFEKLNQKLTEGFVAEREQAQSPNSKLTNEMEDSQVLPIAREIYNDVGEMWYYLNSTLLRMKRDRSSEESSELDRFLMDISSRKSSVLNGIERLQKAVAGTQTSEMTRLKNSVERRFHYLQNPKDCATANKLICKVNSPCGFGCQIQHLQICFLIALGTRRTLILDSSSWSYAPEGWESVFKPISMTCTVASSSGVPWRGEEASKTSQDVFLPLMGTLHHRAPYLPLAIPEDLAPTLIRNHGHPPVWWLGQVARYLLRPQQWLEENIQHYKESIGFESPIVGIHVRRTDKLSEAAYHTVSEYMAHVIDWYQKLDLKLENLSQAKIQRRRVFIASDEPSVIEEARKQYPEYTFIGDPQIAKLAAKSTRYSKTSLTGLIADLFLLSECDFLVGTFSSQISRLAYELMQTRHADASTSAHSLDDIFFFGGQGKRSYHAVYDHIPKEDEIELRVGDPVDVAGNHWDGYSLGTNHRTGQRGLYPSFKVKEVVLTAKFPTYPET